MKELRSFTEDPQSRRAHLKLTFSYLILAAALLVMLACGTIYQLQTAELSLPAGQNSITTGDKITFSGVGQPGNPVEIIVNGQGVDTVTADAAGHWSYSTSFDAPGDYQLQAGTWDPSEGDIAYKSRPVVLTVYALPGLSLPAIGHELVIGDEILLTGTGQPGRVVEIVVDGQTVGTETIAADGTWTYQTSFDEPGDYQIQTRLVATGDSQAAALSDPLTISVVEPVTAALTLSMPPNAEGLTTNDQITLSGSGEPGSQIDIVVNGEVVETVTINSFGRWTYRAAFDEPGDYEFQVQPADGASAVSPSDAVTLSVAEPEPEPIQPTLRLPSPAEGWTTDDQITLSGSGGPGDELEIVVNGEVVDTVTVNSLGRWTYQTTFNEPGDYELQVQRPAADGAPATSTSIPLTLSVTEPEPEVIQPTLRLPSFAKKLTTGDQVALSGSGGPGDELEILVDGDVIDTVTVNSLGNWSYQTTFNEPGDYELQVQRAAADTAPTTSLVLSVAEAEPEPAPPAVIFPKAGGDVIAGQLTIIGTADPAAEIEVMDGETLLGSAEAAADGEWLYTLEVTPDTYQFQARLAADNRLTSEVIDTNVVSAGSPRNCAINAGINRDDNYIVGICDTVASITRALGLDVEDFLAANPQIEDPNLIFPGQILAVPQ